MTVRKWLLLVVLVLAMAHTAMAAQVGLDEGCCSDPLGGGVDLTIRPNQSGVFAYFNSTDFLITALTLTGFVGPFNPASSIDCAPFAYFNSCVVTETGDFNLTIRFSNSIPGAFEGDDVNDDDEDPPGRGGIPPAVCENPENSNCIGHFRLTFNDRFSFSPNGRPSGWFTGDNPPAEITFHVTPTFATPEPATWGLFGTGLSLFAVGLRRRRRG